MQNGCCGFCNGFFLSYRDDISERFATLFETVEKSSQSKIHSKWGWYNIMYELADGDLTKMETVTLIYIEEALTFLAYEKDIQTSKNLNVNGHRS
jgi:hypothetical protein